jgi:hypothetical protein
MLSVIPNLSSEKSKILVNSVPCPLSLRQIYENPKITDLDKKLYLQDKFYDSEISASSSTQRKIKCEAKLSKRVYSIFTEMNPDTVFDEN